MKNINMPFPSGHIEYSFSMYVDHDKVLICDVDDSQIKAIEISKSDTEDCYDPKWRLCIMFNEVASIEEIDKIGSEIKNHIFNLLSFKLKIKINDIRKTGHGVTPREGEGAQCHIITPPVTFSGAGKTGGRRLDQEEINEIEKNLFKNNSLQKNTLIDVFSYAMKSDDPIVKFMLLYLILYEIYDSQKAIDNFIRQVEPDTIQTLSPKDNKPETIYTKLRNEITHRVNTSPEETRNEIIQHLSKFTEISHKAILQN